MRKIVSRGLYTSMEGLSSGDLFAHKVKEHESAKEKKKRKNNKLVEFRGDRSGRKKISVKKIRPKDPGVEEEDYRPEMSRYG